jgi:hypothetical protein
MFHMCKKWKAIYQGYFKDNLLTDLSTVLWTVLLFRRLLFSTLFRQGLNRYKLNNTFIWWE